MKLIIEIPDKVYEMYKDWDSKKVSSVEQSLIANAKPYEERPQVTVFLENADESTLWEIKKELEGALSAIEEKKAYEEARREAMRLDDNEDTLKWKGTH